jgi:hypothetical protein
MSRRRGLGEDPLDAFLPRQEREQAAPAPQARAARKRPLTVTLPPELVDELRDAVVYLEQRGARVALAGLVEEALAAWLERLRASYDVGERFPHRGAAALRPGARVRQPEDR